jgi:hypothetical protein
MKNKTQDKGQYSLHHRDLFLKIIPGVMSEAETSSSRLRRGAKQRNSYGGTAATAVATGMTMPPPPSLLPGGGGGSGAVMARPRTSPSQAGRSPGPGGGPAHR